jgi:uncharacterized protein (TIGR03790 family)
MHRAAGRLGRSRRRTGAGAYSIPGLAGFQAAALVLLATAHTPTPAAGASQPEIAIVVNDASAISRAIGEYYRTRRGVPPEHVVHLSIPVRDPTLTTYAHETIARADFEREIRAPVEAFLTESGLRDRIEIIVTTKGVPLRIREDVIAPNREVELQSFAAVDAELAVLFSGWVGRRGLAASVNPYFRSDEPFRTWRARHPNPPLRYLVARLTGYQAPLDPESGVPRDVKASIDAATGSGSARVYAIDEDPAQPASRAVANQIMLAPAAAALRALGLDVVHDRSETFRGDLANLAGYASWGSNHRANPGAPYYGAIEGVHYPGSFAPRALVVDLVSFNARSFTDPTRYGQSLLADLLRLGASGGAGHVFEPTLLGVARPHILLAAYAGGTRAVEAYFRSVPFLGWTNVYVGDPLMTAENPVTRWTNDRDGDGARDKRDNCLLLPNPDQRDTDGDGCGNLCDADFDGDGRVSASSAEGLGDIERLRRSIAHGFYLPNHDLNGDGAVDATDLTIAELNIYLPPGPCAPSAGAP